MTQPEHCLMQNVTKAYAVSLKQIGLNNYMVEGLKEWLAKYTNNRKVIH